MKIIKRVLLLSIVFFMFSSINIRGISDIDGKNFDVTMNIKENGVIEVVETIDIFFNGSNQGIYITIPNNYRMDLGNGEQLYVFPVKNFRMLSDDEVQTNTSSEGIVAQIGTAGEYITGPKQYKYAYEIHTQELNLKLKDGTPYDLFYINVISRNWEYAFENISFEINFPKPVNSEIYVFATEQNLPVEHKLIGNTLSGVYTNLPYGQGISVETALPDGYFDFPTNDFTIIPGIGILLLSILSIVLYPKFGKEYPVIETVEFKGPKDISSAEAGYVFRGHNNSQDIVSLIVYWASRGYINLVELDDNGDDIQINKVKDLVSDNESEIAIFKQLFISGDSTSTKQLTNKFAPTIQYGITHLGDRFRRSHDKQIFDGSSSFFKGLSSTLMVILVGILGGSIGYKLVPLTTYFMIGGAVGLGIGLFVVLFSIFAFSNDGISTRNRSSIPGYIFAVVLAVVIYIVYETLLKGIISGGIVVGLTIIFIFALSRIANMGKRTQYGAAKYGEILGLKRFIETAEIERLKMFAEETPSLFYDLLPYTYVLGLSDVWMHKFETITIQQPDWYQTSNPGNVYRDMYIMNSLNRSMSTLNTSMTSVPQPTVQSGGGKIGGGGFGGSGGGGFGGGGFGGSGGGGGW